MLSNGKIVVLFCFGCDFFFCVLFFCFFCLFVLFLASDKPFPPLPPPPVFKRPFYGTEFGTFWAPTVGVVLSQCNCVWVLLCISVDGCGHVYTVYVHLVREIIYM